MTTIRLDIKPPEVTTACLTCGAATYDPDNDGLCDTCALALTSGVSIEEARAIVEDGAAFWQLHLGRADGQRCTCGTVDHLTIAAGARNYAARIDLDVRHATSCPLGPPEFDWSPVDEDARERVFGYRGQAYHAARLASILREVLHDREVLET